MNTAIKLFKLLSSRGTITIIQKGFLYSDRVDTRKEKITLKDFIILTRHLLEHKNLKICFETEGKPNADGVIEDIKNTGVSVEVLRKEPSWLGFEWYEVDLLLHLSLPQEELKELIEDFYVVVDAVLVYPVGYISWDQYFNSK